MSGIISVMGCRGCGKCRTACDEGALLRIDGHTRIDLKKCTACMRCVIICPNRALKLIDI